MKLKNSALQELYDTLTTSTFVFTPSGTDPIDEAFRECDEKLSDSVAFAVLKDLQDRNDILEGSNKALLEANLESVSKTRKLEKARDNADRQATYFMHSRDDWRSRAKHAEKEVEDLKKQNEDIASQYQKLTIENKRLQDTNLNLCTERDYLKNQISRLEELLLDAKTTLEKANADRANLQEAFDKLSGENRSLNARIDCLRLEVNWYRKHYRENFSTLLDSTRDAGYKQGQNDLWDKLQEVSDYYYFGGDDEFDTDDCEMTSMTDIIDNLNVDQFLEAYKNWHKVQEQHRIRLQQPWECTLEAKVEINRDLLKKVCGIDSDD